MAAHAETAHEEHHEHPNYVRVWAILLVLLAISITGPFLGVRVVTLITAFGIAIVKAYLVAKNFMHVNIEPRFIVYLMCTMLVFVLLFFAGVSPDVMKFEGANWAKPKIETPAPAEHGAGHSEEHAAPAAEGHSAPH